MKQGQRPTDGTGSQKIDRPPSYYDAVREILHALSNAVSITKLYPAENPAVREAVGSLTAKLTAFLNEHEKLELAVEEFTFLCDDTAVFTEALAIKSLPFFFFKDGLYALYFYQGLDAEEITDFLDVVRRESLKPSEESDIVTALWEKDFSNINYYAPDYYLESRVIQEAKTSLAASADSLIPEELMKETVEIKVDRSEFTKGRIDIPTDELPADQEAGAAGSADRSPAASMDPALTRAELGTVEDMIHANRTLSPEEEFTDLTIELLYMEKDLKNVGDTLDAIYEYHLEQLEKGNFSVVIMIIKKARRLQEHLRKTDQEKADVLEAFMKKIVSARTLASVQKLLGKGSGADLDALFEFFSILGVPALALSADLYESSPNADLRRKISDFVSAQTASDLGLLARLADNSRPAFSLEIIRLLEKATGGKGVPHLAVFMNFADKDVKTAAIAALGRASGDTVNRILLGFLKDKDEDIRIQAALRLDPEKEVSRIAKIIKETYSREFQKKSFKEKQVVFAFIGRSRTQEAARCLKKHFTGRQFLASQAAVETKLASVIGLENLADAECRKLLERGAGSSNRELAAACSESIIRLSGRPERRAET